MILVFFKHLLHNSILMALSTLPIIICSVYIFHCSHVISKQIVYQYIPLVYLSCTVETRTFAWFIFTISFANPVQQQPECSCSKAFFILACPKRGLVVALTRTCLFVKGTDSNGHTWCSSHPGPKQQFFSALLGASYHSTVSFPASL